jgi:putative nucleotidyltransferase with HDIG domain
MTDRGKILAVDDTPASLKLLSDILREEGYEVRSTISGELALKAAFANPPELVLLDVRMPEMDGYEVCRRLKANPATASVPVIFVSAVMDTDEKVQGFELGAVDFVTKPFQRNELLARVHAHLEVDRLRNHLEELVEERSQALRESERKQRNGLLDFIGAIAATVEMRDPYTAGHQRRVAQLAVRIAQELNLPSDQTEGLYLSSIVHDIGKVRTPAEILTRPGRLSDIEFNLIKQHPATGYEVLKAIQFPWPIAQTVEQHHERMDGSGYPNGLKGDEILFEARILSVADVVEAMISNRPYRPGLGVDAALDEISKNREVLYAPLVVDACMRLFQDKGFAFEQP